MSDLEKAAMTALFAVIVYVLGQFLQKSILEPIQEQRRLIGETAFALVFYSNVGVILSTQEDIDAIKEASTAIRKLASQLRSTLWTIPLYSLFSFLGFVRNRTAIMQASSGLIGYSNSLSDGRSKRESQDIVAKALKID